MKGVSPTHAHTIVNEYEPGAGTSVSSNIDFFS